MFLEDHEEDLLRIFREEMEALDEQIPEESFFIDIKMVPLGETILKAALHAISRFLAGEEPSKRQESKDEPVDEEKENTLILKSEPPKAEGGGTN
jgi:hypothetical protein